jgi:ketosteroid isomerase-like protein
MSTAKISDLVRQYFAAYEAKDRQLVDGLLSGDFTFTSPIDDRIDRATYFKKCWPNSARIRTIAIERIVEHGSEAFVRYRSELFSGAEFRNTEIMRTEGGKIVEVDVYFGRTLKETPQEGK